MSQPTSIVRAKYDFTGKTALVTGAASGLGRATALAFAEAGAAVILGDVNDHAGKLVCDEIFAQGGRALFRRADVSAIASCRALVAAGLEAFEHLDYAFNNAGIVSRIASAEKIAQSEWNSTMSVNLTGVFNCLICEVDAMKSTGGVIINNASVMGLVGSGGVAAYSASKHGVIGLTKSAAMDYGRLNIRVNAICPGFVRTPMTSDTAAISEKIISSAIAKGALRRLAEPHEIADAVLWLCSDSASYITGVAIPIDGGFTAN